MKTYYCPRGCNVLDTDGPAPECGACGLPMRPNDTAFNDAFEAVEDEGIACAEREIQLTLNEPTNADRRERGRSALEFYVSQRGEAYEENSSEIADLIADLLHLTAQIDSRPDAVERTLQLAQMHFESEHQNPEHER